MNDPKNLWQNQQREQKNMSLEDLQVRLRRLHIKARRDMILNTAIGVVMLGIFVRVFASAQQPIHRFGWGLIVLTTLLMLVAQIRDMAKALRLERLPSSAGLTTCLRFYREMLENRRTLRLGSRSRIYTTCAMLLLAGLVVLLIPEIQVFYLRLQEPGAPDLKPWIPFFGILVFWGISVMVLGRRRRLWLRREFEVLDALEKENR